MTVVTIFFQACLLLFSPAVTIWLAKRNKIAAGLSPIVLCYAIGILAGNQKVVFLSEKLSLGFSSVSVVLAIPLLLFSLDIRLWFRLAKVTLLSAILAFLSVVVINLITAYIFHPWIENIWQVSAMMVGVHTGGTLNFAAIQMALHVPSETFVVVNLADILVSGLYYLFLISVGYKIYGRFLPPFKSLALSENEAILPTRSAPLSIVQILMGVGFSLICGAISVGLSLLFPKDIQDLVVILSVTVIAIFASLNRMIRQLPGTYETGEYLLLAFAVAIGSLADFTRFADAGFAIVLYTTIEFLSIVFLHIFLCARFKIDRDTAVITATASIYSPAFVGPVASRLKNREVIVSGIASGLIGFAIGNFLGISVGHLLKWML